MRDRGNTGLYVLILVLQHKAKLTWTISGKLVWPLLKERFSTVALCFPPFSVLLFSSQRQTSLFGESGNVPLLSPPFGAIDPHLFLSSLNLQNMSELMKTYFCILQKSKCLKRQMCTEPYQIKDNCCYLENSYKYILLFYVFQIHSSLINCQEHLTFCSTTSVAPKYLVQQRFISEVIPKQT